MKLRTYKINTKPVKATYSKKDISTYCDQELFLIVSNTEKYYKLRWDTKLIDVIKKDFIYNNKQITYLINNIDLI